MLLYLAILLLLWQNPMFYEYHSFFVIIDICVNNNQRIHLKPLANFRIKPKGEHPLFGTLPVFWLFSYLCHSLLF